MSTASLSVVAHTTREPQQTDTDQTTNSTTAAIIADADADGIEGQDTPEVVAAPPHAMAEYKDPHELIIDENVRETFDLDAYPEQEASIRTRGVRAPALAELAPDGSIHVYEGQLRVLLARKVGLAFVPVWITEADPDRDENEYRIERTFDQIYLNDRRIPLPDVDRAKGIALALELGATPNRVAQALQRTRSEVTATGAIGASPTARRLLAAQQFRFDQLAIIADYEARGDTEAVAQLEAGGRYDFTYTHRLIDNERRTTRDRLESGLAYAVDGFRILTTEPDPGSGYLAMDGLVTEAGDPVTTDHLHTDPGRWVVWLGVERGKLLLDTETGAPVDPATVDWRTRRDAEAEPRAGMRHADSVVHADHWTPTYYLPETALPGSGFTIPTPEPDPEADAAAAAVAVAEREQARLDRRRVRVLNERGEAANDRRHQFLPRLLTGATLPPGTAQFVAETLARRLAWDEVGRVSSMLGINSGTDALVAEIGAASANRAWKIALAMQIAIAELRIGKSLWRDGGESTARYLRFLAEAAADLTQRTGNDDFALVDVEQAAARLIDYHDIDITT